VGILYRGLGPQCIRVKAPLRLVQPVWRGEFLAWRQVRTGERPLFGYRVKRSNMNSSTMKGAKALASKSNRRRCRTAKDRSRRVSGCFYVRPAETYFE
jgi:hypothetical protein